MSVCLFLTCLPRLGYFFEKYSLGKHALSRFISISLAISLQAFHFLRLSLKPTLVHRTFRSFVRSLLTRSLSVALGWLPCRRTHSMSNIPITIIIIAPLRVYTHFYSGVTYLTACGCLCCRLVVKRTSFRTVLCVVVTIFFLFLFRSFFKFQCKKNAFFSVCFISFCLVQITLFQFYLEKKKEKKTTSVCPFSLQSREKKIPILFLAYFYCRNINSFRFVLFCFFFSFAFCYKQFIIFVAGACLPLWLSVSVDVCTFS